MSKQPAILIFCLFYGLAGISQTNIVNRNLSYIDSVESSIVTEYCKGFATYPAFYKLQKVKGDLAIVGILNKIYDTAFCSTKALDAALKRSDSRHWVDTAINGLMRSLKIVFRGNYLKVVLELQCVDTLIIGKKCMMESSTVARCDAHGMAIMDFKLFKQHFGKALTFPIELIDFRHFGNDEISKQRLMQAAALYKRYQFGLERMDTAETWISQIFEMQFNGRGYCCYVHDRPPGEFVRLIKEHRYDIIRNLLFSPNYLVSVNAMEAMIYGAHQDLVVLDDAEKERIETIKEAKFDIVSRNIPDVELHYAGYKMLDVSDERIISKYKPTIVANWMGDMTAIIDSTEEKAIAKVFDLPEVQALNGRIDTLSKHTRGVSLIVRKKPVNNKDYYWIQAGDNNEIHYDVVYNFYVYLPYLAVRYFDTITDKVLTLEQWRKSK